MQQITETITKGFYNQTKIYCIANKTCQQSITEKKAILYIGKCKPTKRLTN